MDSSTHPEENKILQGGCHCGAVRFQVMMRTNKAIDCNCSICNKKGFLHYIVPPEDFELLQGQDALSEYRFNTKTARHLFCKYCGIHSLYRPRSHPNHWDINLHCLDQATEKDFFKTFSIQKFNGQFWEENINSIRSK